MAQTKVILLACGSFNPPTNMHLRMFEVARDNLNRLGKYSVIGGIISPVHDEYGKKELVSSSYRCEMLRLALQSSDWIRLSNWECTQASWTRTRQVLQFHQNVLNSLLNDERNGTGNRNHLNANVDDYNSESWITNDIRNAQGPIQVKLLCGADFLQSFSVPGLWEESDIETIVGQHGIVVVSRQGYNPHSVIYESDVLARHQNNIYVINEWIPNEISSSKIRRALRRRESVKYLVQDSVISFIGERGLYGCSKTELEYAYKSNINEGVSFSRLDDFILTPSPSDVNVKSVGVARESVYLELSAISRASESSPASVSQPRIANDIFAQTQRANVALDGKNVATRSSPGKGKKVGFTDESRVVSNGWDSVPSRSNARHAPGETGTITQTEAEEIEKCANKPAGILLRRSNSDAIVSSRRGENGEVVSVKIQFTKDGIKVISDKESIV